MQISLFDKNICCGVVLGGRGEGAVCGHGKYYIAYLALFPATKSGWPANKATTPAPPPRPPSPPPL
jgi:hypothetical protein